MVEDGIPEVDTGERNETRVPSLDYGCPFLAYVRGRHDARRDPEISGFGNPDRPPSPGEAGRWRRRVGRGEACRLAAGIWRAGTSADVDRDQFQADLCLPVSTESTECEGEESNAVSRNSCVQVPVSWRSGPVRCRLGSTAWTSRAVLTVSRDTDVVVVVVRCSVLGCRWWWWTKRVRDDGASKNGGETSSRSSGGGRVWSKRCGQGTCSDRAPGESCQPTPPWLCCQTH